MRHPLVSIITVTLNCLKDDRRDFLLQNFESVHRQTYGAVEHIVVDGASTDGTVEFLEEFRRKGWISYVSHKDHGIYDAMNEGHRLAKGEYVLVLNSDDWYASDDVIENMVKAAVEDVPGVVSAKIELVFEPVWDKSRMSEEALIELGLD